MASLDVYALFTNISLDETKDICVNKLVQNPKSFVKRISKNDFRDYQIRLPKNHFSFNNKFYIQVDGAAVGSPLGPILANIFLSHHQGN